MTRQSTPFGRGILVGMLIIVGAAGLYWFITPNAEMASGWRNLLVGLQTLLCLGGASLLAWRERRHAGRDAQA